jgi:hypothetical protein
MLIHLCALSVLPYVTVNCKYKCRLWKRWVLGSTYNFLLFYLNLWAPYIAVTETDARLCCNKESNVTVLEKNLINER